MLKAFLKSRASPAIRFKMTAFHWSLRSLTHEIVAETIDGNALRRACAGKTKILLNIGCGKLGRSGWINVDALKVPGVFRWNVLNGLPIVAGAVEHIHMEHFLEHLEFRQAIELLVECDRVLQPGGSMRIIVPDAEKYMTAYSAKDEEFFGKLDHLGGTAEVLPTKATICNQSFHMAGDHKFGWDFETLQYACNKAGFRDIKGSSLNDVEQAYAIDGQDWWRPVESLYANCVKVKRG
jgi:predicted SAM-dependent methyltransferase